ncbi:Pyruvate dehydrogenase E2 (dihydrolipoamideacetyltransferase) [Planococcus halocryophilus Or1]|uniref:Uncharacterized protein n=1 Tax=Planococcus halocryophilus TaxID=1215089 RepID=A0A1C7DVF4_9BACL|nr:biotin/lipoyl-containing protein [Planococcus halocryophilus]ANU15251.1 hypothetical protein BBI08_15935 [Planococcus halocryophilus]EMF47598.1 Pyruvate dehydrogenase E2 (dihydrolipoamideacetyltransferase) [Planococcus halocryophilus Or1]
MIEVCLPKLADDVDESLMVLWFVSVGDFVEKGAPLVEVQTEKAVSEITAESSGTIQEIKVKRGDSAKIGDVLATLDPDGAADEKIVAQDESAATATNNETDSSAQESSSFVRVSPRLRRLAKELGVDLDAVKGSGKNGSITEEDIRDESGL